MSTNALARDAPASPRDPKRRRLNGFATPAVLTKPFKSPFRTPQVSVPAPSLHEQAKQHGSSHPAGHVPGDLQTNLKVTATNLNNPPQQAPKPFRSRAASPLTRQLAPSQANGFPDVDAAAVVAQRMQTSLITQIAQVRQDTNALTQAISLASRTSEDGLNTLIERWTSVAREAAEEVFSTTKDKVNKMGGVGAWREREQQQREWQKPWDEPPSVDHGDVSDNDDDDGENSAGDNEEVSTSDLGREERRAIKQAQREMRREHEAMRGDAHAEEEPDERGQKRQQILMQGDDDDTFTMDMMLTMLNIDLDTIGYSKEHQMWIG